MDIFEIENLTYIKNKLKEVASIVSLSNIIKKIKFKLNGPPSTCIQTYVYIWVWQKLSVQGLQNIRNKKFMGVIGLS